MTNETKLTAVEWYINMAETLYKQFVTNWITLEVYIECKAKLKQQAKEMEEEQKIKNITDYNIMVTEFLLNPLFNLEHSEHAIACEKLSDIRNQFISVHIVYYNETYGGNK